MSFRLRETETSKMDIREPRIFGGADNNERGGMNDDLDSRRFDSNNRGRRPQFGRGGRRPSPTNRDRNIRDVPSNFRDYGRDEPSMMRDRSPMRSGSDDRFSDRFKKEDRDDKRETGRPFFGDESRDRFMDKSRSDGPGGFDHFSGPGGDSFSSRSMNFPSAPSSKMPGAGFPKPNELEIIVVNKNNRVYAENVEMRVKDLGIVVDMLFLKDEALLTQTIDDIARRGSLYAMVISPQNETHRSVTINILHGTPQEHRNMPLADAMKLLGQNFHKHIRMQREKMERERSERGPYVGNVSADREIQFLLCMLADGRWLSESELTTVIRYLTERRDKIAGSTEEDRRLGRAPIPPTNIKMDPAFAKDVVDVAQKEQDLQNRIMNIMNQGAPASSSSSSSMLSNIDMPSNRGGQSFGSSTMNQSSSLNANMPVLKSMDDKLSSLGCALGGVQTSQSSDIAPPSTFINFGDPSVQKALDNLIQTGPNILKNIKSTLSNQPQDSLLGNTSKPPISSTGMGSPNDAIGMPRDTMGSARGPSGMSDVGGNSRGQGSLDMGLSRGPGSFDLGLGLPRPIGNFDMGPPRRPGNFDMSPPKGPGNFDMGPPRGSGNSDMGPPRGPGSMDLGGARPQRNIGSSDMGPARGGFGGASGMGGRGPQQDFGGNNMQDSRMRQLRMADRAVPTPESDGNMGGMGQGGTLGMGNEFPGQNQFGQYKGPTNQSGNFSDGSFNSGPGPIITQHYGGGMGRRPGGRY